MTGFIPAEGQMFEIFAGLLSKPRQDQTCNAAEMSCSFSGTVRRQCERRRIDRQGHETIRSIRRRPPAKDCDMGAGSVATQGAKMKAVRFGSLPFTLPIEPLTVRIPVAVRLTGIGRSKIYELIAAGKLDTVKVGASTLITVASLKRLVQTQQR
jgi:excisionase family DNA binding protein